MLDLRPPACVWLVGSVEAAVSKRARGWLAYLTEVTAVILGDPLLFAPVLLVILLALIGGWFVWRSL
jgi:hypothetical protein